MRRFKSIVLVLAAAAAAAAQSPDPPISDTRLTVHTLLREDVFAGYMENDMTRLARAEQNLERLMKERPGERANLMAWKGGIALHRAVRAQETGKPDDFARDFKAARDAFAEAAKGTAGNDGVVATIAGSYALFSDRLPEEHRAAGWAQAYDAYSTLWKQQGEGIDKLPLHFKGELLAGMAQSAQRTGRSEEAARFLDTLLTTLPDTPYEKVARIWKNDPSWVPNTNLTCKNCHDRGRLSARLAALNK